MIILLVLAISNNLPRKFSICKGDDDGPLTLKRKVTRGGSWKDVAYFIQNGSRSYEYQDTSKSYVGFRCVQSYIGRSANDTK